MVLPAAQCASVVESPDKLKANLETLKRTNACRNCYLQGAKLQGANLHFAKLDSDDFEMAKRAGAVGLELAVADAARKTPSQPVKTVA